MISIVLQLQEMPDKEMVMDGRIIGRDSTSDLELRCANELCEKAIQVIKKEWAGKTVLDSRGQSGN